MIEPFNDYAAHLETMIDFAAIKERGISVVVDPMFGAGIGYLEELLGRHDCKVTAIHNWRDPLFGGSLPEPSANHLHQLCQAVRERKAELGVALDGDADRLGVVDPEGRYYSPNEILVLFLAYLVESRGWQGTVARTVATMYLLDKMAASYGLNVVETPVGFKYIGQAMREQQAFIGGEESGGVSIRGHIPEKDGILASLLFIEMLAKTGKTAAQLLAQISASFGKVFSERLNLSCSEAAKQEIVAKMANWQPSTLAGTAVKTISRLDGLKIILENGSWCLARSSGTEPVFRIYTEAASQEGKEALQQAVKQALFLEIEDGKAGWMS